MIGRLLLNVVTLVVLPFWLHGLINRVKAWWSGRKGPPLFQLAYDVRRLMKKTIVFGDATTPVFRIAPYVYLATSILSALVVPVAGIAPIASFPLDFVWLAYSWGLGRMALALAAFDTGSSFEGMGATRAMTYASLLEPALFLSTGALAMLTSSRTLDEALAPELRGGAAFIVSAAAGVTLFVVLLVEAGRLPIDDPNTHLELTMVHEVMVLDHSGSDLAAIQVGTAVKLLTGIALIARLLNPWARAADARTVAAQLVASACIAVAIGTAESLVARIRLRSVPAYIAGSLVAGFVALAVAAVLRGSHP